jgi:Ca2+-binding RTX toxin-like protein
MIGESGNDLLTAYRGADHLFGGSGNDVLKAGNGRDVVDGGDGSDILFGGFGLNTFEDELDGEIDQLYFRSDQWAENWLYGSAGNSPNGEKADKIEMLDEFDQIYIQGVETSQLSYGLVDHNSNLGETLSGIGIYASGALEAVYVGDNLSMGQIAAMTQGTL